MVASYAVYTSPINGQCKKKQRIQYATVIAMIKWFGPVKLKYLL